MPPSLESAYARLARAETHLAELNHLLETFRSEHADPVQAVVNPSDPPRLVRQVGDPPGHARLHVSAVVTTIDMALPPGMEPIVGDVVQNLRIPLDYLAYQLAWLDSGVEQEGTQFPIFWKPKYFTRKVGEYLRGVHEVHQYTIERLQPYRGGRWLSTLAGLANPDKHKDFLRVTTGANVTTSWNVRPTLTDPDASGHVDMRFKGTATVFLSDGQAVDLALAEIRSAVRSTLDDFSPCFAGACTHSVPRTLDAARRS